MLKSLNFVGAFLRIGGQLLKWLVVAGVRNDFKAPGENATAGNDVSISGLGQRQSCTVEVQEGRRERGMRDRAGFVSHCHTLAALHLQRGHRTENDESCVLLLRVWR